jgi:bifunctional UDP-N-acetylglucosamine pyrophosphorylase/glucosamine-1-phosphate N-acetyltransferase
MNNPTVLILAAGKGTRMKSSCAKVLHTAGGLPMIEHVVRTARAISDDIRIVVGHQADAVRETLGGDSAGVGFIEQTRQLGTGHAVMAARTALDEGTGPVLILPGDVPLIRPETLGQFLTFHRDGAFAGSVMTAIVEDADGYGRLLRRAGNEAERIVEHRDADAAELEIREINSGIYLFDRRLLFASLDRTRTQNAQGEYYLTDVVAILSGDGSRVGAWTIPDPGEAGGVNSRGELAGVDRRLRTRKCDALMAEGVTIIDPATAWIDVDVRIGADSTIHPSVTIEGASELGERVTVRSFSRITNSRIGADSTVLDGTVVTDSEIGIDVSVGPRAHLRMGTVLEDGVRVGNYVEVKKSRIGEGTKAMHLSYIGDATIGRNANVGAGVITCNYDGQNKHPTVIGDRVFVGSDSQLIAPVTIGDGAYVAAGSTISEDVPADSLAIGRGRQVVKPGWVKKNRQKG